MTSTTPTELWTEEDLARRWNTSTNHVRRLRVTGALAHVRIGRFVRFRPEDVQQFLEDNHSPVA